MAKVLISMREDFLDQIDELADNEQRTRSELIRQALRVYMRRKGKDSLMDSLLLD
jgi:CopG family transcriptional regulator / antitoxin EndoAI